MRRKRSAIEERRVERLLARLGRRISPPPEAELRRAARAAAAEPRLPEGSPPRQIWRPLHVRWVVAVAAALLLGSGFGFGLGTWRTPSGSAGTSFVGLGFLPAKGWTVVQSGSVGPTGTARAIAANVSLHPDDGPARVPYATLESLPPRGVLIFATFSTRGAPAEDVDFATRDLPLRIAGAAPEAASSDPLPFTRPLARYRLRAAVEAYNVDARIYFGSAPASAGMLAAAQGQLNRLVVASEQVTLAAKTTIVGPPRPFVTLFGAIASAKAGEVVTIQGKECGVPGAFFRGLAATQTVSGGGWTLDQFIRTTTIFRAVWRDARSAPVTVRTRISVSLFNRSGSRFDVTAGAAAASLQGKRVVVQRLDARLGTWRNVRSLVLDGTSYAGFAAKRGFRLDVPKGAALRAVVPRSQAGPCYLAGYSNVIRT